MIVDLHKTDVFCWSLRTRDDCPLKARLHIWFPHGFSTLHCTGQTEKLLGAYLGA